MKTLTLFVMFFLFAPFYALGVVARLIARSSSTGFKHGGALIEWFCSAGEDRLAGEDRDF
jgi:hypothetical protein